MSAPASPDAAPAPPAAEAALGTGGATF
jgi:hypothetical protein